MNSELFKRGFKVLIAFAVVTVLGGISYDAYARGGMGGMGGGGGGMGGGGMGGGGPGGGGGGGGALTAVYVPGANGLDPRDSSWGDATATIVTLERLIDYVVDGGGGGGMGGMMDMCMSMGTSITRPVTVSSVHNGSTIYFRYEWSDATADTTVDDNNLFGDAMALEIPLSGSGSSSLDMGSQGNPVNIMFWRADQPAPHNIVAGGIGTPQHSPDAQNLQRYQDWNRNVWTVIISRPMTGASDNQVTLVRGGSYSFAMANWNGSDKNRDGKKAFSNWQTLTIQ